LLFISVVIMMRCAYDGYSSTGAVVGTNGCSCTLFL